MNLTRFKKLGFYGLLVGGAAVATLLAVRARAAGIPDAAALTYTGYLENPDGTPVSGTKGIGISLYTAESGGKEVCGLKPADIEPISGRFQLELPAECTDAVKANPNLWVELLVEGSLLGRTKLGAVPYAVEAAHAVDADNAAEAAHAALAAGADGELEKRIAAMETKLGTPSVVRAHLKATQSITEGSAVAKVILLEDSDAAGEFDPVTSAFTPKVAGNYFLQCNLRFETNAPGVVGWFDASVLVKGVPVVRSGSYTDGWTAFRDASGIFNLAKGEAVTCGANQQASGAATRNITDGTFTAYRLGPAQ